MTVSSTNSRLSYNGDGVSVNFATPYFLANADIKVYVGGVLKTLTTDYTLTGAGTESGGTCSFLSAPASGTGNVVILRDPDQLQSTDLPSNDPFPSSSVEKAFDKLTMLVQRCRDLLGRSFTLPDSDASGASTALPSPSANAVIGWNSAGTGLDNFAPTSGGMPGAGTIGASMLTAALLDDTKNLFKVVNFTHDISITGAQSVTGVGFTPKVVMFFANITTNSAASIGVNTSSGDKFSLANLHNSVANTWGTSGFPIIMFKSGGDYGYAHVSSFDADGFTLTWAKFGAPTSTAVIYALCIR